VKATGRMAGVFAPVITPFKSDLSPDAERLLHHCRWLLANDVGLAVFGTNSEGNSLSVDERIGLLDHLIDAGLDAARMMPGTGCSAFTDTVRLTAHAVKRGCGGALMLPPFFYKNVSDEGVFRTYSEIIQRVGDARLRVFLYHIPQFSMVPISLGLTERLLAEYPEQVAGMKDSSGDWANTAAFLDAFAAGGFQVFPAAETMLLRGLPLGAAGCISATANVNPAAIADLYRTWREPGTEAKQAALDTIRGIFARFPMIPSLKAAVAHWGRDPEWRIVRPPLVPLEPGVEGELLAVLQAHGFDMPGSSRIPSELKMDAK
jgi:4-hydroxy-tetrahydrodipicolinate synthase